jgi:hypothetical protein
MCLQLQICGLEAVEFWVHLLWRRPKPGLRHRFGRTHEAIHRCSERTLHRYTKGDAGIVRFGQLIEPVA